MASRVRLPRITLANLSPAKGSQHSQKRVGRGQGSGYGRTAGRGHKGQNSRSGPGPAPSFEGGQTPITKLFPKRGFVNLNQKTYAPVNLDRIQHWIDQGRLECSREKPITARELLLSGCIHQVHDGVKILASGREQLKSPLFIVASRASSGAITAIERKGGAVICKYYNEVSLRDCVKGRTDRVDAAPTRRQDIMWYTNSANRGYISKAVTQNTHQNFTDLPFFDERWTKLNEQLYQFSWQAPYKSKLVSPATKRMRYYKFWAPDSPFRIVDGVVVPNPDLAPGQLPGVDPALKQQTANVSVADQKSVTT
ncbi:hypothetical protein NP233_g9667 [Leucocoprinus birnbaumii]|uniref:Large ribosomal subunit protein uL15/eL18 domain-containing protein n=1 Tax=Leucocoprinus birnbaumii TaxID=56174 RepID=A0AAD5YQM2_9AGAR|nr:hypothetical protein NP233_g9667 [Leucocoprinus birnbaumii]